MFTSYENTIREPLASKPEEDDYTVLAEKVSVVQRL